jgi:hypothetical protein
LTNLLRNAHHTLLQIRYSVKMYFFSSIVLQFLDRENREVDRDTLFIILKSIICRSYVTKAGTINLMKLKSAHLYVGFIVLLL